MKAKHRKLNTHPWHSRDLGWFYEEGTEAFIDTVWSYCTSLISKGCCLLPFCLFNREYPDFYKKLYSLLDPSIYHVKYRARFFHLADLFLSSSHLPAYLVAAFIKRLSRLALTAPPEALLMVIPFICNLFRRHPACKVLMHRPNGPQDLSEDPYIMEQEEPSESRALESSLWELQSLQNHYHPDVAQAAAILNQSLSEIEDDISGLLELSASELFDKEIKKTSANVPLEFEQVRGLFGKKNDIIAEHFALD